MASCRSPGRRISSQPMIRRAVRREVAADPLREVCLQRVGVAESQLPGPRLHLGRGVPLVLDHLIAADVNERDWGRSR